MGEREGRGLGRKERREGGKKRVGKFDDGLACHQRFFRSTYVQEFCSCEFFSDLFACEFHFQSTN